MPHCKIGEYKAIRRPFYRMFTKVLRGNEFLVSVVVLKKLWGQAVGQSLHSCTEIAGVKTNQQPGRKGLQDQKVCRLLLYLVVLVTSQEYISIAYILFYIGSYTPFPPWHIRIFYSCIKYCDWHIMMGGRGFPFPSIRWELCVCHTVLLW